MARTSLLLSIALVLVIASSVSSHPPKHKKTQKNICPPTLGGVQTFPALEISKFIEKKAKSAPNSAQFNTLFSICKSYAQQLAAFKAAGPRNVFRVVYTKYAMITKAMFAAEAAIGIQGSLAAKLEKTYNGMAGCFVKLEESIAEISAKYKFNANAKLSQGDRDKIDECLVKLKGAINVFVKEITECSMKFSSVKQIGIPAGGLIGGFAKNGVGFGSGVIGLSGASVKQVRIPEDKGSTRADDLFGRYPKNGVRLGPGVVGLSGASLKQIRIPEDEVTREDNGFTRKGIHFGPVVNHGDAKFRVQGHAGGRRLFDGLSTVKPIVIPVPVGGFGKFRGDGEFRSRYHPAKIHLN